jgi:predicted esterase
MLRGRAPVRWDAPWLLRLPSARGPAPLLVALHGKGDRAERFEREARRALPRGWALLVPGAPIPRDRSGGPPPSAIGGSWYLYDGDTPVFRESLARAEAFVAAAVRRARAAGARPRGRAALLGFSQGAYLAGVLAVRRPDLFRAAVLVGGRLKVEALRREMPRARALGLRLLALHGARDPAVGPGPAGASVAAARAAGLDASFEEFDAGHEFTAAMAARAREWLGALP